MGLRQFRDLLVRDSGELIIVPGAPPGDTFAELLWAWRSARNECKAAYDAWCRSSSSTEYVILITNGGYADWFTVYAKPIPRPGTAGSPRSWCTRTTR